MRAEAPERVLVGAQLAEVQAVAVDVVELAELAARRSAPSGGRRRGGTRAGGRPSGSCRPARRRRRRVRRRRRWSPAASPRSSACPPRATATASSAWVGTGVASTTASSSRPRAGRSISAVLRAAGKAARELSPRGLGGVAQPGQLAAGDRGEVAGEVRAPVAEADDADADQLCVGSLTARRSPARSARRRGRRRRARAARRGGLSSAASAAPGRGRRACSSPPATVSTHSVFARRVTQGTPARYASFWTPPESVSTARAPGRAAR